MHDEQKYLSELQLVVDQFRFSNKVISVVLSIIAFLIVLSVALFFNSYFLAVVTIGILVAAAERYGLTFTKLPQSDGKLAYRACLLMEQLINIRENPDPMIGCYILTVGQGQHSELYCKFIAYYPHMASKKLKRLANIYVKIEDTGCDE